MKNKKAKMAIIGLIALVLVTIGLTYAYWLITRTQTKTNVIGAGCLDISLTDELNDIYLSKQYPIPDETGMNLTPYTFTITNNCDTSVDYHLNLETLGDSSTALLPSSIKVAINDNATLLSNLESRETTIEGAYASYQLLYGRLEEKGTEGSSDTHSLRIWMDIKAPNSEMNKTFTSKISVTAGQGIENPFEEGTIAFNIVGNAGGSEFITTVNDFGVVTTAEYAKLHKAEDDIGTSYYFRGAPLNNYVKFGKWSESDTKGNAGKDMYWRIIRINGDGTIRMIYDGTEAVANGTEHNAIIGKAAYNTNDDDAKYVGYTYENDEGIQEDSTIKSYIDAWYDTNLETNYGTYIADSIFCNDRTSRVENGTAYYGARDRLVTNKTPKLSCNRKDDRYTINTEYGNGYLTNPIGLVTADEIAMAGGVVSTANTTYYLHSAQQYWSFSPFGFNILSSSFLINYQNVFLNGRTTFDAVGARPVINLKADVEFIGEGTIDSPYEIVME